MPLRRLIGSTSSLIAAPLVIAALAALVWAFYSYLYGAGIVYRATPRYFTEAIRIFVLLVLYSYPAILTTYLVHTLFPPGRWLRTSLFLLFSALAYAGFFFVLVYSGNFWQDFIAFSLQALLLGFFVALFWWTIGLRDHPKKQHTAPSFGVVLFALSVFALLTKLFLANFRPEGNPVEYLAIKTLPSLVSVFNHVPNREFILLNDKAGFAAYEYIDFLFVLAWWLIPVLAIGYRLGQIQLKK